MLTYEQRPTMRVVFNFLICIQNSLLASNIEFDIRTMTYDEIVDVCSDDLKTTLKKFPKKEIINALQWAKKIYDFKHTVYSQYHGLDASFCNKTLTLTLTRSPVTASFVIDTTRDSFLLYTSYSDTTGSYDVISQDMLFKRLTFNLFIKNFDEYYSIDKQVLEMIFC